MSQKHLILESPDYANGVLKQLLAMQKEGKLCDVRLTTDGGGISLHRLVIMAASPYLKSKLSAEVRNTSELIHFHNIPVNFLEIVVHYMYTGKLMVETHHIDQLLEFCEDIELANAVRLLKEYAKDSLVSSDLNSPGTENGEENSTISIEDDGENSEMPVKSEKQMEKARSNNRRVKQTPKKRALVDATVSEHNEILSKTIKLGTDSNTSKNMEKKTTTEKNLVTRSTRNRNASKSNTSLTTETKADKNKKNIRKSCKLVDIKKSKGNDTKTVDNKIDDIVQKEREKTENKTTCTIKEENSTKSNIDSDDSEIVDLDTENANVAKSQLKSCKNKEKLLKNEKKDKKLLKRDYIKVRRNKEFPCSACEKVLTTNKRLVFHEFSQHGIDYDKTKYKMVPCSVEGCSYVSANTNNLRTHMKSRHGTERPHICEFCGKAFKLQSVLATHLNIHTGAKVYECKQCGEHFNQQSGLDVHIKRHHMGEASWVELCHLCSEKFLQKSELSWHLFRLHNIPLPDKYKVYICDKCDFMTKSSQDLERHKNAHDGIKQFECQICQKTCTTKSELNRHLKYHGEKTYLCTFDDCKYACVDAPGLRKHIQLMHTHKNYKPYICSVCKYKTGVKGNLDKHIRQVHNLEVVTKHTLNLKLKYKDFETGDIITKDGQLVISAQDRKLLQEQVLEQERTSLETVEETVVVDSIIICESSGALTDQTDSNTNTDPVLITSPPTETYPDPQASVYSSAEAVQLTSVEPVKSQGRLISDQTGSNTNINSILIPPQLEKYSVSQSSVYSSSERVQLTSVEPVNSQGRLISDQTGSNTNIDSILIPPQLEKYSVSQSGVYSSSERVQLTSVEPVISQGKLISDQTGSNRNIESILIPSPTQKYSIPQASVYSSSERVQLTSVEPVISQGRLLSNYIYSQSPTVSSHLQLGLAAQDLRMGFSSYLTNPQLYREVVQRNIPDTDEEDIVIMNN